MIQALAPRNGRAGFSLLDAGIAGDLPAVGHLSTLKITSWSMFPTIHKGDVIQVGPADRITAGDVVVFHHTGEIVCHRITGIGPGDGIRTQGDQATGQDPPIRRQDILGRVTAVVRGDRRFAPAEVPRPSAAGVLRMNMDLFITQAREQLLGWALTGLAFLKQRSVIRNLAAGALKKHVRFYVGVPAPVRLVQAYCFVTLHEIAPGACPSGDLIVLARLGRHPLGTLHPASGELRVRRLAAGLGLEECLRDAQRHLQSVQATTAMPSCP